MIKLKRNTWPSGHNAEDFECFGPPAKKDGEFSGTKLADLGCFVQGEIDSNKYYHSAQVRSKKNRKYYVYNEYGRVGQETPNFNLLECIDEPECAREYEKQLHAKNDKRGTWITHPKLGRILQPKPDKDCYVVRPQMKRSTGLPDAKRITDGVPIAVHVANTTVKFDKESTSLLSDLQYTAESFTKGEMASGVIPALDTIENGRIICGEATKLIKRDKDYIHNKELEQLTNMLYSLIPKKKNRSKERSSWMLTPENIATWLQDLDAFESAAKGISSTSINTYGFSLKTITDTDIGKAIKKFIEKATRNVHQGVDNIKVKNVWEITRDRADFTKYQTNISKVDNLRPLHQIDRPDLDKIEKALYDKSHTFLLFHGTRTVNVGGILKESIRLPRELSNVAINGAMFGSGAYFADDYKKSMGYTSYKGSYWSRGSGSIDKRGSFIFICDVVLGRKFTPDGGRAFQGPPAGYDSIFAEMSKASVYNNEFILFDKNGINTRYLVEF